MQAQGCSSVRARHSLAPSVLMAVAVLASRAHCLSATDHVLRRVGKQLGPCLTFALAWQCPHNFCSLGSYPDKGANSQLMGIKAGII